MKRQILKPIPRLLTQLTAYTGLRAVVIGVLTVVFIGFAQAQEVRIGTHRITPEANITRTRSIRPWRPSREVVDGKRSVLVQFETTDNAKARRELSSRGVELGAYLGGNAYYALVPEALTPSQLRGSGLRAIMELQPEWKVQQGLLEGKAPKHALRAGGKSVAVDAAFPKGVDERTVGTWLSQHGLHDFELWPLLRTVRLEIPFGRIQELAQAGWCIRIASIPPPEQLFNHNGALAGGGARLARPIAEGGAELTGQGVKIGVWDLSIGTHVDLHGRFLKQQGEAPEQVDGIAHGTHVLGSILGGGLLDPLARGVAPGARAFTYNFGTQNPEVLQMKDAHIKHEISLTSNSYGVELSPTTCWLRLMNSYSSSSSQFQDLLAEAYPFMTHVFAAGNARGVCSDYSSTLALGKNLIYVGAVDRRLHMSTFSSWGPTIDGKLFPTVVADGVNVRSTVLSNRYENMDGTSMATPIVTGHLALITQRYQDLHLGEPPINTLLRGLLANTATDLGRPGPDYIYGFGAVNAIAAVRAVEQGWYDYGMLEAGAREAVHRIEVPQRPIKQGYRALRVMLTWNDPYTEKTWEVGENNLLNDLDLSLRLPGGSIHKSWKLNPADPTAPATKGGDHLNTMEQVIVEDLHPGGVVEVIVSGEIRQGTEQLYTLTWYFEDGPEVLSPIAGDSYSPGDTILIRADGMRAATVEMSTDGGKTFQVKGRADVRGVELVIPSDTEPTEQAIIRLSDEKGLSARSGFFTILGRPREFTVGDEGCGTDQIPLEWQAVPGATQYEVLEYEYSTGAWEVRATTAETSFLLDASPSATDNQRLFSVRALAGDIRGLRAEGALLAPRQPIRLKPNQLPWEDQFEQEGAPHLRVLRGQRPNHFFVGSKDTLNLQARTLVLYAAQDAEEWTDPFANEDNVTTLQICNLDLREIPTGERIAFSMSERLQRPEYNSEDFAIRLRVNGEVVPDATEMEVHHPGILKHSQVWDLSDFVGQEISLEWQLASRYAMQFTQLFGYSLFTPSDKVDVVVLPSSIPPAPEMGEVTTKVKLLNRSMRSLTFPLRVEVDGTEQAEAGHENVDLKPYQLLELEITPNFEEGAEEPLGKKMVLTITADVAEDVNPEDNTATVEVQNLGATVLQPDMPWDLALNIANAGELTVEEECYWTDMGGAFNSYAPGQGSVLYSEMGYATTVIEMEEWDLAEGDTLFLYLLSEAEIEEAMENESLDKYAVAHTFTGKGQGETLRFLDNMLAYFRSTNPNPGSGWQARCYAQELEGESLSLGRASVDESFPNNQTTLRIPVINSGEEAVEGAMLHILLGQGHHTRMEVKPVPTVPANDEVVVLLEGIETPVPSSIPVRIELVHPAITEPYILRTTIVHDDYFPGGTSQTAPEECPFISKAFSKDADEDHQWEFYEEEYLAGGILRRLDRQVEMWGNGRNALEVEVSNAPDEFVVGIYIDAKNPTGFGSLKPEFYLIHSTGQPSVYPSIDWTDQQLTPGERRMRIVVTGTEEEQLAYRQGQEVEWVCALDLTAVIRQGKNPNLGDFSISELSISYDGENPVQSGVNLTSEAQLKVYIHNHDIEPRTEAIEIKVYDGEQLLFTHQAEHPEGIDPKSFILVDDFPKTVDLSAEGQHRIRLVIPKDTNPANNEVHATIHCLPKAQEKDALQCLTLNGAVDDYIDFGNALYGENEATIEGWFRFSKIQNCPLLESFNSEGESELLFGMLATPTEDVPRGAFVLTERNGVFWTDGPVVQPNEWTHLALTFSYEDTPQLYVNGQSVPLQSKGQAEMLYFSNLHLGTKLEGAVTGLRLWNTPRSQEEISQNMSTRLGSGSPTESELQGEFLMQDDAESPGLTSTWDEGRAGIIHRNKPSNPRPKPGPVSGLLLNTKLSGQVLPIEWSQNVATITLQSGTDLSQVEGELIFAWAGTTATIGGEPVTASTRFDLQNTVEIEMALEAFGKQAHETVQLKAQLDASSACELSKVSFDPAVNPSLAKIETISPVNQWQEVDLENVETPNIVILQIDGISQGAVARYKEQEAIQGEKLRLNLTQPAMVVVTAENGRDTKRYEFHVSRKEQTITWDTSPIEAVYGDPVPSLNATSSSNLEVHYVVGDPGVLTWIDGQLLATWSLPTALNAIQEGSARWHPAPIVSRRVNVTPAPLTVSAPELTVHLGEAIPRLEYTVQGLKLDDKESLLGTLELQIIGPNNTPWDKSQAALPLGEWPITFVSTTPELDNYTVNLRNGMLRIEEEKAPTGIKRPGSFLTLRPNPTSDVLELHGARPTWVEIHSLSGQLVLRTKVGPDGRLHVGHLPTGLYILRAQGQALRFVKM